MNRIDNKLSDTIKVYPRTDVRRRPCSRTIIVRVQVFGMFAKPGVDFVSLLLPSPLNVFVRNSIVIIERSEGRYGVIIRPTCVVSPTAQMRSTRADNKETGATFSSEVMMSVFPRPIIENIV